MKKEIRAFALGMLLSTSIIGAVYYNEPQKLTEAQVDAYLKKKNEIAMSKAQYRALKEKASQTNKPTNTMVPNPATIRIYHLVIQKGDVPTKFAKELEAAKIIADAKALTNYIS